jgi:hypothetical protein
MDTLFFYWFAAIVATAISLVLGVFYIEKCKKQKKIAQHMLGSLVSHEIKELLTAVSYDRNYNAPLKHLCSAVCYYLALGGSPSALNTTIETVRQTLLKPQGSISRVWFETRSITEQVVINIGHDGLKYIQSLRNPTSLDLLSDPLRKGKYPF